MSSTSTLSTDTGQKDDLKMMTADESLSSAYAHLMTFFEGSGDLDAIINLADSVAKRSLYDSLLLMIMFSIRALLVYTHKKCTVAGHIFKDLLELSDHLRKTTTITKKFSNLLLMSKKPVADQPTDLELHAEFVHAILSLLKCAHKLLQDFSTAQLSKETPKIVIALKNLANCRSIAEKRTAWESASSKANFEAAIRLERGLRNLVISLLPPKLLKVVNFLGIAGERQCAISELKAVAFDQEVPGIYSLIGEMILIVYHLYFEMHFLTGPSDNVGTLIETVNQKAAQYPKNIVYKLAKAKAEQITGNLTKAVQFYEEIISGSSANVNLFHSVAYWELAWTSAAGLKWDDAINYLNQFGKRTRYSQMLPDFWKAAFLYTKNNFWQCSVRSMEKLPNIEEAIVYLELTTKLIARKQGHSMVVEGDSFTLAKQFFENENKMIFPVFDILYKSNYVHLLTGNADLTAKWLMLAEDVVNEHEKDSDNRDKYFMALFNKGVLLKHSKLYAESTKCFELIMNGKDLITNTKIVSRTTMELGFVAIAEGDKNKAKNMLSQAIKSSTKKFKTNSILIRSHTALRTIGVEVETANE